MDNQPENAQNGEEPESKKRRVEDEEEEEEKEEEVEVDHRKYEEGYRGYQQTYWKVMADLSLPISTWFVRTPHQIVLTFKSPFTGDETSLKFRDVQKLDTDGRINDAIMQFVINYIGTYWIEDVSKVFIHGTFFYGSLTKSIPEKGFWRLKNENLEPILESNSQRPEKDSSENEGILTANCVRLQRWTKNIDLFEKDMIIFPIHEQKRWMALAIINPRGVLIDIDDEEESRENSKCVFLFYDPLGDWDPTIRNRIAFMITRYLETVCEKTKGAGQKFGGQNGSTFDGQRIRLMTVKNAPILSSPLDCGMYVLHFIEGLTRGPVRPSGPISVNDIPPEFDWSELYPEAEKMCELQRDKIYSLIKKEAGRINRARLQMFLTQKKCGLEQMVRRSRRHSAAALRRTRRNENYYPRSYSIHPPQINLQENEFITNPRILASMPLTKYVRTLRYPEGERKIRIQQPPFPSLCQEIFLF